MSIDDAAMSMVIQGAAVVSLVWVCIVFTVQVIGVYKIFSYYSKPLPTPVAPSLNEDDVPHITVIRPVKGVDVGLYECLASTFRLSYPQSKLSIRFCVADTEDSAYPVLQQLVADFPGFDAQVLVEEADPVLHGSGGHVNNLGPNPKIRNISRAYREAKGDVIWVIDCNIWTSKGAAGRMIDKLFGFRPAGARATPYKFVHQLPLVVDLEGEGSGEAKSLLSSDPSCPSRPSLFGGRLEEMFMSTTHAKFYCAINTVGIAPCIVGKSTMFRKSHLDRFTDPAQNPILSQADASRGQGIDFFSSYICEDHLIGDLIFRSKMPGFLNHGLVFGELAIQPMLGMSISAYIARRVRWLRVRKWTVLTATLVEPGVEPILCCLHLSFALTTLPFLRESLGISPTWRAMGAIWAVAVTAWMLLDRCVTSKLRQCQSVDVDQDTPHFALGTSRQGGVPHRPFLEWLRAWLGRELLALPIWTRAVLLGATVSWRGQRFKVHMDMSVEQVGVENGCSDGDSSAVSKQPTTPRSRSKGRVD